MPTYEYKCSACDHAFERFHSMSAPPVKRCPECGKAKVKRLLGTGAGLIFKGSAAVGCHTNLDVDFFGQTVVVTTGTFLRGLMHIGQNKNEGGRLGDFSAKSLSASFIEAGGEVTIAVRRLTAQLESYYETRLGCRCV